jgi:GNAT superfamily N-acetyltransferase
VNHSFAFTTPSMLSPNGMRLRSASLADAATIAALINAAYRGDSSRRGWTTEAEFLDGQRTDTQAIEQILAAPDQHMLLIEHGGQLIGCVHLEKSRDDVCHFGMFVIKPEVQGRGLGKWFIAAAENFARTELGCLTMQMLVISIRDELIAWYERRGYRPTGERQAFPYGNERFGVPLRDDLEFVVLAKKL